MRRVFLLYGLSGLVSLGYQVAWFRIYVDRFGSTNLTFALVVCNFIAGLGAGSLASRRFTRLLGTLLGTRDKLRLYGAVELLVTAAVLLTVAAKALPADLWGAFPYELAGGVYKPQLGYQLSQLGIAVACIFIPCFFMGMTFPLLCDAWRLKPGTGRFPSALYAWNTLGACTGVLAGLFIFLPWLGHERMFLLMAALNLAVGAYFTARGGAPAPAAPAPAVPGDAPTAAGNRMLLTCAVLSGLLAGALEGDMFKRIDFITSGDATLMALISFWAILGIFLAAWAVGASRSMTLGRIKVLWLAGLAAYAGAWVFEATVRKVFWLLETDRPAGPPIGQLGHYGEFLGNLGHALIFVGLFVFPAYFCVSLLLPYVCNRLQAGHRHIGLAYGLNTLAFCAGLIAFTQIAPRVSIFYSLKLMLAAFAIGVVLLLLVSESRRLALWKPLAAVAAFAAACALVPRGFDRGAVPPDSLAATHPVRAVKSNGAHTTYVVAAPRGDFLFFERHAMSGTSMPESKYMRLMAHFPLLAHPAPRRALLICYGVGHTASAIAAHDTIEAVDVVELNENVIETAPEFAEDLGDVYADPRLRFIIDDGRSFLARTTERYDLITSEPPPPMQAGVYRLYTREYYEQALARLAPRGMMTQWIPAYQMPAEAVELAIRTFLDVFPHALLFTGRYREFIICGSSDPIDLGVLERRFHEQPAVAIDLRRMGVRRPLSLIARVVLGDAGLRRRFGDGRVVADARNDLDFLFHDRDRSAVIDYAPAELLADIGAGRLECGDELRRVLMHLGRLCYHVPDYPLSTLATAGRGGGPELRYADVDWVEVSRQREAAASARRDGGPLEARATLEAALHLAPEQPGVLLRLASVQLRLGETLAAAATLRSVLEIEPRDETAHRMLGTLLAGIGREGEALVLLRRAVELDGHSPDARLALGRALARRGDLDEGVAHLREAARLAPDRTDVKRALQRALADQNRARSASPTNPAGS